MRRTTARRIICSGMAVIMAAAAGPYAATAQSLAQSMRTARLQEERAERDADRKARLPHPVSAEHQGTLTPVDNLAALLPGKTLYLQTPIVQNGQTQRIEVAPIYFASTGQAFSSQWAARRWQVNGSAVCINAGPKSSCMTALSDSTGQAFLLGPTKLLVQIDRIASGDSDNVKGAYQKAQEARAEVDKAIANVAIPLIIGALTSGGGGGGGNNPSDPRYYAPPSGGGGGGGGGGYSAPPIGSLYGTGPGGSFYGN